MSKYVENVKRRFGSFNVAPSKSKLVPGDLGRYLNDMIPGYCAGIAASANDNLNGSDSTDSDLGQSRSEVRTVNIKLEPIAEADDSSVDGDVRTEGPETSNDRDAMAQQTEIEQSEIQTIVIAQQNEMIEKLKEELRAKTDELDHSKEQMGQKIVALEDSKEQLGQKIDELKRYLNEAHVQLITKVKEAKNKLWCTDCNDIIAENPTQKCKVCSLFQ